MRRIRVLMALACCLWLAMPVAGATVPPPVVQGGDDGGVEPGGDDDPEPDPGDTTPHAAGTTQVYQEYAERMRSAEMVSPLGSEVFGESVNLFDQATVFNNTDIDIAGNSELPVRLQRRFDVKRVPQSYVA